MKSTFLRGFLSVVLAVLPCLARASFLSGDALDAVADVIAVIVLIVVPPVVIGLFWIVHVLPEKIAHKKHHPQTPAITTLCLLSLVFGGLLWPIAWLWAYTKPVGYKLAYGTDKSDEYHEKERLAAAEKGLQQVASAEKADVTVLMQRIAALETRLNQTHGGAN